MVSLGAVASIRVTSRGGRDDALWFDVTVDEGGSSTTHEVSASRSDISRLSRESESHERFVERCFEFLLEREPKEAIMQRFDVTVIGRYFPEFEALIGP